MDLLKEVAHISGKSGLYRVLKPTRSGVIVETLDAKKEKSVVGANARVSVLKDISVYAQDQQDAAIPLAEIFKNIREKHGESIVLDTKTASGADLANFLEEVAPAFDRERVYSSDIKKMINWYNTLSLHFIEVFEAVEDSEATISEEQTNTEA